jgi:hypothetical protein
MFAATNAPMTSPRAFHIATLLPNGKVLILGAEGAYDTAELYDPVSGTFSAAEQTMAAERFKPAATLLPKGDVLITAGAPQRRIIIRPPNFTIPPWGRSRPRQH